jgi:tyrosinase
MRKRPFADNRSWRFQAAVHGYDPDHDPYASPTDPAPPAKVQREYWEQCQHASWFFLPWHRMYLTIFEQIVADAVVEAGGPNDWALPYWNYSASTEARSLPWAFRQPQWPDGEPNYLYVSQRVPSINAGEPVPDKSVAIEGALSKQVFSTSWAHDSFGGGEVSNSIHFGSLTGAVENIPHNHIHNDIGGPEGFMSDPNRAALDPIFWCHHSNIDRLWETWTRQPGRLNPSDARWLTNVRFGFLGADRQRVVYTSAQVLDTATLGYSYQDLPPVTAPAPELFAALRSGLRPELVGASAPRVGLASALKHVDVPMLVDIGRVRTARAAGGTGRVLLQLEDVTTDGLGASFDVFVNLRASSDANDRERHHAGRIALFGTTTQDGHGRSFVLDITDLHDRLQQTGTSQGIDVALERVYDWGPEAEVGRVSVSVL